MSKTRYALIANVMIVLTASMFVAACGEDDDDSSSDGSYTIGVVLPGNQIPYYQDLAAGIEAEAERQGAEVKINYADQDVSTQIDQVQSQVTQQPSGLILGPIDREALIPGYQQAADAGIPIVTVADNIGEDGRQYQLTFIGEEYTEFGADKANWVVEELDGNGTVGVVHAIRGGGYTEENWEGSKAVFEEHPGITVIDGPYVGDFTPQAGLQGAQAVLSRDPNVDVLYMDTDDLAYGAIQALKDAGIPQDDVIVTGTDGGEPAIEAVQGGELDYTVSACGYAQGVIAVQTLIEYLDNGTEPDEYTASPFPEFTPENVDAQLKEIPSILEEYDAGTKCTRAY